MDHDQSKEEIQKREGEKGSMKTKRGTILKARDLLLMDQNEWPRLRESLTEKERDTLGKKLAAMTLASARLANYLGTGVSVSVIGKVK
jgi:hypothetical protein